MLGFNGPNIYGPQPGVLLQVHSERDRSVLLRDRLKDGAQRVGMVLGYLDVATVPVDEGYVITASFVTPTPAIGVELARHAIEALNAHESGDEAYDFDEQLWDLQKRRRAEALPVAALQVVAEAAQRGLPSYVRADGRLQIGYGARGWSLDIESMRGSTMRMPGVPGRDAPQFAAPAVAVPWEQISVIPIVALTGGMDADTAAQAVAAALRADGAAVGLAVAAGFDAARALLAERSITCAVLSLDVTDLLQRGLPFDQCAASAVLSLPDALPSGAAEREELVRALGLPMLVTVPDGAALLNTAVPELAALAEYAPCPVVPFAAGADTVATLLRVLRQR